MPKETFHKLKSNKKQQFIEAAVKEFSSHNYDQASINVIIKQLGIARGSVYQYFNDKLDLWLFLKEHCEQVKLSYIQSINRFEYPDFWSYYKALYIHGIDFDLEQTHCSQFLYRIGFKETSEEVAPYIHSWKTKASEVFTQWVEFEKLQGTFNPEVSTPIAVHFLLTISMSVAELLQSKYKVNFEENIKTGKALFGNNKDELIQAVDELVTLLQKALS
jgi:AcrR family transcriptional regulator